MTDNILDRLCERAGILAEYQDIWGNHHQVGDDAKRALLGSMGIATADDQLEESLRDWDESAWHTLIEPAKVVRYGEPVELRLHLPERRLSGHLHWSFIPEHGTPIEGVLQPDSLSELERRVINGETFLALAWAFTPPMDLGYHRLAIRRADLEPTEVSLIVCPAQVYTPDILAQGKRAWGLSVQLYGLRSSTNWGMGDFTDLASAVDWAGAAGADLLGINPTHALFPHNPAHCSPYSPSSRQFLNVLYIGIEAVPEFHDCPEAVAYMADPRFQTKLASLREADRVDYPGVADLKFTVLELLYQHFQAHHLAKNTRRGQAFRAYQRSFGQELYRFALYQALQAHFVASDAGCWGWPVWPEAFRRPDTAAVEAYAKANQERVEWFEWLQWLADEQLEAVKQTASQHGMSIGLYQDLAVGVDKSGAEAWMHGDLFALDARIGCPPDDFSPLGQDWGLPPWIPHRLKAAGYAPFIAMLRANMRHAGALRIDHVMGLMRLYWVPPGMRGDQGGYVVYPFNDLLGILALESRRNRCMVVGEDLGTVPDDIRTALHEAGVLSYRLFYFERQHDGHFLPPGWYPRQALVAASTHDLPSLRVFWRGRDIEWRTELDLSANPDPRTEQIANRAEDRARLLAALAREGLLPADIALNPEGLTELSPTLLQAIHVYLARGPAQLVMVQAEDMLGEAEQANLPGTVDAHPNWRRKLSLPLEAWPNAAHCVELARAIARERA